MIFLCAHTHFVKWCWEKTHISGGANKTYSDRIRPRLEPDPASTRTAYTNNTGPVIEI